MKRWTSKRDPTKDILLNCISKLDDMYSSRQVDLRISVLTNNLFNTLSLTSNSTTDINLYRSQKAKFPPLGTRSVDHFELRLYFKQLELNSSQQHPAPINQHQNNVNTPRPKMATKLNSQYRNQDRQEIIKLKTNSIIARRQRCIQDLKQKPRYTTMRSKTLQSELPTLPKLPPLMELHPNDIFADLKEKWAIKMPVEQFRLLKLKPAKSLKFHSIGRLA